MRLTRTRRAGKPPTARPHRVAASERERTRSSRFGANLFEIATGYWLPRVRSLTTQAQRPGPREAWIATGARWPGSLQREAVKKLIFRPSNPPRHFVKTRHKS